MPRFHFRLEALLDHRNNVEKQKQRALAQNLAVVASIEQELRQVERIVRESTEDVRQKHLLGRIDMNFMAAHRRFMLSMQRKATDAAQRLLASQRRVHEARLVLVKAATERRTIERLREKQLEVWQADHSRRMALEMDEIGMQMSYQNLANDDQEVAGEEGLVFEPDDSAADEDPS